MCYTLLVIITVFFSSWYFQLHGLKDTYVLLSFNYHVYWQTKNKTRTKTENPHVQSCQKDKKTFLFLIFLVSYNYEVCVYYFFRIGKTRLQEIKEITWQHQQLSSTSMESEPLSFSLCLICGSNQELHQPAIIKQLTFDPTTIIAWNV